MKNIVLSMGKQVVCQLMYVAEGELPAHRAGEKRFEGGEDHVVFVLGVDVVRDRHGCPGGRQLAQRRRVGNPGLRSRRKLLHPGDSLAERLETTT